MVATISVTGDKVLGAVFAGTAANFRKKRKGEMHKILRSVVVPEVTQTVPPSRSSSLVMLSASLTIIPCPS